MFKKKMIEGIKVLLALIVLFPLAFVWLCALMWAVLIPWLIILSVLDFANSGGWYDILKLVMSWLLALGISWVGLVLINSEEEKEKRVG